MTAPIGKDKPRCGAKTRGERAGRTCLNAAMANGRCRMHGGTNEGAPAGNTNAVTAGIYFTGLRDDEKPLWDRIPIGSLDDELRLLRMQLRRAHEALHKQEQNPSDVSLLEIDRTSKSAEQSATGSKTSSGVTKKRADYRAVIYRLTGRIAQLENTQRAILASKKDADRPKVTFTIEN